MIWVFLLLAQAAAPAQTAPTQIERGEALFHGSVHNCGACHALKGKGTAVGPDLKDVSRLSPRGIAMSINSTVTQYVQIVKLKSGRSFPSMPPKNDMVYDLSKMPPEPVKATAEEIASTTANTGWKHPVAAQKIPPQELADIIAYIRFAGANNRQKVSPDDVQ